MPIPVPDRVVDPGGDGVEGHHELAAVVGVDGAEGREHAVLRQAASRPNLGIPARRDGNGDAGRDHDGDLAQRDLLVQAGVEVPAGGPFGSAVRELCPFAQALDLDGDIDGFSERRHSRSPG
ncbi:MAG: hypothetical protein U5Q44_02185 [Dehalococcoidia bacterium]|nr:hypothetical protein [Dehalococcoidia bacterium]